MTVLKCTFVAGILTNAPVYSFQRKGPWRCSGGSNTELVNNLHDAGILQSRRAIEAMEATNRVHYSPDRPFEDRPQYIGYDATISAPHMHAHALELLGDVIPEHNAKVLDVGCGSGYLTAAFARLAGKDAVIYGMDYIPGLVELSLANIVKDDKDLLDSGRVGDGWKGWKEAAPFDAIHVGAAAETVPLELVAQLRTGGRMVVPVGPESASQILMQVDRITEDGPVSESYITTNLLGVIYVPLVKETGTNNGL